MIDLRTKYCIRKISGKEYVKIPRKFTYTDIQKDTRNIHYEKKTEKAQEKKKTQEKKEKAQGKKDTKRSSQKTGKACISFLKEAIKDFHDYLDSVIYPKDTKINKKTICQYTGDEGSKVSCERLEKKFRCVDGLLKKRKEKKRVRIFLKSHELPYFDEKIENLKKL